jgi:PAS domain S-box-containing protein
MRWRTVLQQYGVAVLCVLGMLLVTLIVYPYVAPRLYLFFVIPVVLSTAYGGIWPGILAILLSILVIDYGLTSPFGTLSFSASDLYSFITFGSVTLIISVLYERLRMTETRLRRETERFRSLFRSSFIGIVIADGHGAIYEANDTMLNMLGYSRADLQAGRFRWDTVTPPEYLDQAKELVARLERGEMPQFAKEYMHRSGQRVPVLIGGIRLEAEKGLFLIYILDLTAQRQAEDKLRETSALFETILASVPSGISASNTERILFSNEENARIFGYPAPNALIGQTPETLRREINLYDESGHLVQPGQYAAVLVQQGTDEAKMTAELLNRSGHRLWIEVHAVVSKESRPNAPRTAVTITNDITARREAELALRESESRFRTMADNAPVMIAVFNTQGQCTFVNRARLEFVGRTLEECLDNGWIEDIHPEDRERYRHMLLDALTTQQRFTITFRKRRADGEYRWVESIAAPRLDPGGTFSGFVSSSVDMTNQRRTIDNQRFLIQASTVLASSLDYEKTLRSVAELAVPMFGDWCNIYLTRADGKIQSVARAYTSAHDRMLDTTPIDAESLAGVPNVFRTGQAELYATLAADGQPTLLPSGLELIDGVKFSSALVVPLVARDQVLGAIQFAAAGSGRHYSAEDLALADELAKRAAIAVDNARLYQDMRTGREELDVILKGIADAVISIDQNDGITFINPAAAAMLGLSNADSVGQSWYAVCTFLDEATRAPITTLEALISDQSYLLVRRGDGHEIPVESHTAPIQDDADHTIGMILVLRDITERHRIDEAIRNLNAELEARVEQRTAELAESNRELEAFSYSVSHDLRAPLRAITGFAQMFIEESAGQLAPAVQHYVDVIVQEAEQMGVLIDRMLAFSRLNRAPIDKVSINVVALARAVIAGLERDYAGRDLIFDVGDLPPLEADPTLFRQVMTNLISNAVKFTRGRAQGRIEIASAQQDGQQVYWVRDNGVGFDQRYADKLFGVFQRLHSASEFEGNGVGLAIVQRIIHRHGGRVWVEAEVDRGATFYFTLNPHSH